MTHSKNKVNNLVTKHTFAAAKVALPADIGHNVSNSLYHSIYFMQAFGELIEHMVILRLQYKISFKL